VIVINFLHLELPCLLTPLFLLWLLFSHNPSSEQFPAPIVSPVLLFLLCPPHSPSLSFMHNLHLTTSFPFLSLSLSPLRFPLAFSSHRLLSSLFAPLLLHSSYIGINPLLSHE
jgi:hypothetical protein